ncbi:MAG: hypothetical protein ACRD9R_14405 [Pyrinomonadaceae bacterium]
MSQGRQRKLNLVIRRTGLRLALLACSVAAGACLPAMPFAARAHQTPAAGADITQAQADLYERWRSNVRANERLAYESGKEYLAKYPEEGEYGAYVRKWVDDYERASRRLQFQQLLYRDKKFGEAYAVGKQVLADDPANLKTMINLSYAGYFAQEGGTNAAPVSGEALGFARQSIELIETGNSPSDWKPFSDRPDSLGFLYFIVGEFVLKDAPADAYSHFRRALEHEGSIKTYPVIYARLAAIYTVTDYDPLAREFQTRYSGRDETPESRAALDKVYGVVDKIVDAYARAVAHCGAEAKYQQARERWHAELTNYYKARHNNSTDGLDALLAGATTKPLP